MANQGFVQSLNLLEVPDGAELIQNLAGGTVDADMRLFAGLSSKRSQLFWDRFYNSVNIAKSPTTLTQSTQFEWDTDYSYTDEDIISVTPINLIKEVGASFVGFDGDGVLVNNLSGSFIAFDRGEGYTPGTYNLNLQGCSGQNATAEIIVNNNGLVESVEITNSGTGYARGDTFTAAIPGNGVGFNVRIISNPWKVIIIGNFAWDVANLNTKQLSIEVNNTSSALDGDYNIDIPGTGVNAWHLPTNNTLPAFDINRKIFADTKISNNLDLYDIDGDGTFTSTDADLIYAWADAKRTGSTGESAITSYLNSNSLPAGAIRNNTTRIYNYLQGLSPLLWDIDGTGFSVYESGNTAAELTRFYNYFTGYIGGGNYPYPAASTLLSQTPTATTATTKHAIAIEFLANRDPQYAVPAEVEDEYERPYFVLKFNQSNSKINAFDNFVEYGSQQTCTTNQTDWINNVQVGSYNSTLNYRIIDKFSTTDSSQNITYFVVIVTAGTGKPVSQAFGSNPTLTPINSAPVFDSSREYGVFDSNSTDKFFLRTNPRSTSETAKQIITFSEKYTVSDSASNYNGEIVNVTTLIPDIIMERDDSLTTENIEFLEAPVIVDTGDNDYVGTFGAFSYNIEGYSTELNNITDNVDESIYLRTTKYRIDRSLYYVKEITVNGFMTSFDPDGFNSSVTDLTAELSPGIYISSSASQITNPLASDFANKTRSFSSDYNPWKDDAVPNALSTTSLAVNINDLVWTSEIKLDVGNNIAHQGLSQTLDGNFNSNTVSQGQSFKLKMLINGEEYFIIMRKS